VRLFRVAEPADRAAAPRRLDLQGVGKRLRGDFIGPGSPNRRIIGVALAYRSATTEGTIQRRTRRASRSRQTHELHLEPAYKSTPGSPGSVGAAVSRMPVPRTESTRLVVETENLSVVYDNVTISLGYRVDLLVENEVIVEVKSVESVLAVQRHNCCRIEAQSQESRAADQLQRGHPDRNPGRICGIEKGRRASVGKKCSPCPPGSAVSRESLASLVHKTPPAAHRLNFSYRRVRRVSLSSAATSARPG